MKHNKRIILITFIMSLTLIFSGCWNNTPIDELGIVSAIGVDKLVDGQLEVTAQVVVPGKQMASGGSGGSDTTIQVTADGKTIFQAIRNLIPHLGKKAYFSHTQVMVIGEAAAKEGLSTLWDFIERDHEMPRIMPILVAKGSTAKEALNKKSVMHGISAMQIYSILENNKSYGRSVNIEAFKVSELLQESHTGIILGIITPGTSDDLDDASTEGSALLKHGKLLGYLNGEETRGYLFAINQIKSTILNIHNPKEPDKLIDLEVIKSEGKINAELKDGKPELSIEVKTMGNIGEEQGSSDLSDDVNVIENEAAACIKQNIKSAIIRSQKDYDCDILDFYTMLYKKHYSDFKKISGQWDNVYKNLDVKVSVQFELDRPGLINKPAYNP